MWRNAGRGAEAEDVETSSLPFSYRFVTFNANAIQVCRFLTNFAPTNNKTFKRMGSIFIIQGILIYIYAFDHRSTSGRLLP